MYHNNEINLFIVSKECRLILILSAYFTAQEKTEVQDVDGGEEAS